jgi:hypothetical protein
VSAKAMSMPADTPAPLMWLPCQTTRSATTSTPSAEVVAEAPVGRRLLALEQARGGVETGSRADRRRPLAARGRGPQPLDQDIVVQNGHRVAAARDDDQIRVGQALPGVGRDDREAAVTADRLERARKEVDLRVGPTTDHLVGADQIERGEVRI